MFDGQNFFMASSWVHSMGNGLNFIIPSSSGAQSSNTMFTGGLYVSMNMGRHMYHVDSRASGSGSGASNGGSGFLAEQKSFMCSMT